MAAPSKTAGTVVLAHQAVTHPASVVSAAIDVSTIFAGVLSLFHALVEAAANTNPGTFHVFVSAAESGNEDWVEIPPVIQAESGTADTEAMTATEPVGETVLAVASTTGFVAKDKLYVQDASVVADGEWATCKRVVTNTSIDLATGLTNAKDSSDVIWNDATMAAIFLDLSAVKRLIIVFSHEGATGANAHIKAHLNSLDSIG